MPLFSFFRNSKSKVASFGEIVGLKGYIMQKFLLLVRNG